MVERFEMYAGITKRLGGGGVPIRKYALSPAGRDDPAAGQVRSRADGDL